MFIDFNINFQYIFLPIRCYPCREEDVEKVFGLKKINNNEYIHKDTQQKYYEADLHDFGWGPESGYVLHKEFSFNELIKLSLCDSDLKRLQDNQFGAIALIIKGSKFQKNYISEFIAFLKNNLDIFDKVKLKYLAYFLFNGPDELIPDYWYDPLLSKNPEWDKTKKLLLNKIRLA